MNELRSIGKTEIYKGKKEEKKEIMNTTFITTSVKVW